MSIIFQFGINFFPKLHCTEKYHNDENLHKRKCIFSLEYHLVLIAELNFFNCNLLINLLQVYWLNNNYLILLL